MKLQETRLTIIGLGLIGGSIAHSLHDQTAALVGVDTDLDTVALAKRLGIFDRITDNLASGLQDCDLAILAVPVSAILTILARLGRDLPAPRFLLDVGSTKAEIVRKMEALPASIDPLGGHPLCGRETAGLAAADSALFQGQVFALTQLDRTSQNMLQLTKELIEVLEATPLLLDAESHDRILAITSHLPYLLAAALVATAIQTSAQDDRLWEVVASGFRDSTRLAASDVTMMVDILRTNQEWVRQALDRVIVILENWKPLVAAADSERLRDELTPIQMQRSRLFLTRVDQEGRNES